MAFGQQKYHSEFLYGITKATNSGIIGGGYLRYAKRIKNNIFQTYGVELVNIKDPLETRTTSFLSGKSYIHGKLNYLYALRLQYGREIVLFEKAQYQGVQVATTFSGGPTVGFQTPYYLEVTAGSDGKNTNIPASEYYQNGGASPIGPGGVFEGVLESKLIIGFNAKAAVSFEFGLFKHNVFGLQTGVMLEAFTQKVKIMNNDKSKAIMPNAFITLFYGRRK